MDHSEAVQLRATEKYLLGDLPTDQREAFEDHFFECTECAQDVKATAVLIDNARSVLREAPVPARELQPARQKAWWGWLQPAWGLAAAAAILAVVGYQNLVTIPHLKTEMAAAPLRRRSLLSISPPLDLVVRWNRSPWFRPASHPAST